MNSWRSYVVLSILFLLGALIVWRLADLQVVNHGHYKALAQGQQIVSALSKGDRGNIFAQDKNGELYTLAINESIPYAFVSPAEIKAKEKVVEGLSEILEIESAFIENKLKNNQSFFEVLKKPISQKEAQRIHELGLAGANVGQERKRSYPQGTLASHVLGFSNHDGIGQYGVEGSYNDILDGKEGLRAGFKNPAHYLLSVFTGPSKDGQDIILTLDYNIQSVAETLLAEAEQRLHIEGGTIVVLEPSTGKILAIANAPVFDPNKYEEVKDLSIFQNPAIQKIYEPGSVFKAFTMAAALNENTVTPNTVYHDTGALKIGGRKITNYDQRVWGDRTMTEVLEYSINTGAVYAERQVGHETFIEYIEKLGLFEATNVELAGEIYSRNAEFKKGYEINYATAAFGQGVEMTPLQVTRAFAALANNGTLPAVHIVEGSNNNYHKQVFTPKTASEITSMLVSVVENGFAKSAQIPGYRVAGKTGTAQVSYSALGISKSGYSEKTIQSFVGYAPAFDPRFVILVKLDNPASKTADVSAVPIFQKLSKYIIDYYQIPPSL